MKVLLINGSPRENGNTFLALSEVAKTLNEDGIETEIISIGKHAVQGCIACGMCGRTGQCTFRDDLYFKVMRAVKDGIDGLKYLGDRFEWTVTSEKLLKNNLSLEYKVMSE